MVDGRSASTCYGMLTAARDRLPAAPKLPRFAGADAAALPVRDAVADVTLATHMLYHVPEPARAVRELRRVTRPGGRVVIVLNGAGHLKQLRAVLAAVGGEDPRSMGERVGLDDGEAMARALFPSVARHDFVGELRVPTAGPIADYVRSIYGTSQHADAERIVAKVLDAFPRSADGHCVITSHAGCLICRTG
jgi:SAM-dependent methyltransferase